MWENYLADTEHFNLYVNALVYKPVIKLIRRIARPGDAILEVGCGSGRTAVMMADMGYKVTALDKEKNLIDKLSAITAWVHGLSPVHADMFHIPVRDKAFHLVYSCGVMEHFDPPDILRLLEEQRRVARYVVVDVPNDRCSNTSYGDERFYSDETWKTMMVQAGLSVEKVINRGLDKGKYVGNCSSFLAKDAGDQKLLEEHIDVYDFY